MNDLNLLPYEEWPESSSKVYFIASKITPKNLPVTAVKLYAVNDGKLLLTHVPRGWDIPGGHIEQGETPEKAIVREVEEETGYRVNQFEQVGYFKIINTPNKNNSKYPRESCMIVYACLDTPIKKVSEVREEATDSDWVEIEQIAHTHHNWSDVKQSVLKELFKA